MIDKIGFIYRIQYENLISEIDSFCSSCDTKYITKNNFKISIIKILKQNYNNTMRLIDNIKED